MLLAEHYWDLAKVLTAIAAILTAIGGGSAVTALFNNLADRRRQKNSEIQLRHDHQRAMAEQELKETQQRLEWQKSEFVRLSERIEDLEKSRDDCLQENVKDKRTIGELTGTVNGLEKLVLQLNSSLITSAQREAAKEAVVSVQEKTHEVAKTIVQDVVTQAVSSQSQS